MKGNGKMKLYHGTENADKIQQGGFQIGLSRHMGSQEDCVYFSDVYEYAAQHGDVVEIEIDSQYVELFQENPLNKGDHGYIPGDEYCVYQEHLLKIKIVN